MKKLFYFISYIFIILIFVSCEFVFNTVEHEIIIDDFMKDKLIIDTVEPKKNKGYLSHQVEIKGDVSDTVIFKMCDVCYEKKIIGKVDTMFHEEFYGQGKQFLFIKIKGNKNTKGKLKIQHKIF